MTTQTQEPTSLMCKLFGHKYYQKASDKRVEMLPEAPTKAIYTVTVFCTRCGHNFEERQFANL